MVKSICKLIFPALIASCDAYAIRYTANLALTWNWPLVYTKCLCWRGQGFHPNLRHPHKKSNKEYYGNRTCASEKRADLFPSSPANMFIRDAFLMTRFEQMLNGNRDKKYSSVFVGQTRIDRYSSAARSLTRILLRKWNGGGPVL